MQIKSLCLVPIHLGFFYYLPNIVLVGITQTKWRNKYIRSTILEGPMTLMKEDPTMMPSTGTAQILADTIPAIDADLLIGKLAKD